MVKKRILIVEDNHLNMRLFTDLLESKGAEVISINDGTKAVSSAQELLPDLILMDIQLHGGISGADLIKTIKSNEHTKKIPIIAITAFAMKDDEDRILKSGCEAYLAKPVSIDYFFETIEKFITL